MVVVVKLCTNELDHILEIQLKYNFDQNAEKKFYQICNSELSDAKIYMINKLIEMVEIDLKIDNDIYVVVFRPETANECIDRTFNKDYKSKIIGDKLSSNGFVYPNIDDHIIFLKDSNDLIQIKNTFLHEAFHLFQKSNIKNMGLMQNYDRLFHLYIEATACKYQTLRS